MITTATGLTMDFIDKAVFNSLQKKESDLQAAIQKAGDNPSTTDLLILQQGIQEWSMMISLQSTLTKQFSDTMKEVIQKSS
jgi:type III secretion protein F